MPDRYVSRAEIADRLSLTERSITGLVKKGKLADGTPFPSRVAGKARTFPVERCFEWYLRFKIEEAIARAGPQTPVDLADAEKRKAIADAELAEHKLAQLRREFVPIGDYRRELERVVGRLRGRLSAAPGEYAPRIMEPLDMPHAVAVLREMVADLLANLQGSGEVADDEGGDGGAGAEDEAA